MTNPAESSTETPEGSTTTGEGEQSTPAQEQAVTAEDFRALQAEFEKAQARIKSLSDENGKHRNAKKEAEQARIAAAEKAGELEPVVNSLKQQLAEREHLATFGERALARLQERVEKDSAKLPEDIREKLSRISDLEQRADALDFYLTAAGQKKTPTAVPAEGAPAGPSSPSPNFHGLQGQALVNAIAQDPAAFWATKGVGNGPKTVIGRAVAALQSRK